MKEKYILFVSFIVFFAFTISLMRNVNNWYKFLSDNKTTLHIPEKNVSMYYFNFRVVLSDLLKTNDKSNIYLVNSDPLTFYYLRYQLYPSKVFRNNEKLFGKSLAPTIFDYFVFFDKEDTKNYSKKLKNYELLKEIKYERNFLLIYKRNG